MKKILSAISLSLAISLIPIMILNGQDTKTVKKIKIVIDEGSGEKVIIDTLLNEDSDLETIKLGDGRMIFISESERDEDSEGHHHYRANAKSGEGGKTMVWTSRDSGPAGEKVIVVKKEGGKEARTEKHLFVTVETDDDSSVKKSRYVVAKDGLVVTVEGEDDTKAKEVMNMVEEYLRVNKQADSKSLKGKTDTKKVNRK